jgi:predicted CXXCH cytochrome family protein
MVLVLLLLIAAGCSKEHIAPEKGENLPSSSDRLYKILSFFIDGLPQPQKEKNASTESNAESTGSKGAVATYRDHGPYAANLCDACHIQSGSNELIMPIEQLCQSCHVLNLKKKYVHGPVVAGGCRVCHDPHGSPYPYLLVSESKDFCYHCHSQLDIEKREVHKKATEACTFCHDAHASDNKYLLRTIDVAK